MKKLTAFLLVLVMISVELFAVSCANKAEETETGAQTKQEAAETAGDETSEVTERLPSNVPDSLTLGGNTVTFLVIDGNFNGAAWESQDIYQEEDSTDPIASAVYRRNKYLEDLVQEYQIKLENGR